MVPLPATAEPSGYHVLSRVSFVVPSYNASGLLRSCLESIVDLTRGGSEVLVVDDGSTEDIRSVVEAFAPSVRYCWQPNQGPAAARNCGVWQTSGEYIRFIDADDFLIGVEGLLRQVALLDDNPAAALVYGQAIKVDGQGLPLGVRQPQFARTSYVRDGNTELGDLLYSNYVTTSSTLVRRTALEQIGAFRTDLANDIGEDWDCWMRLALTWSIAYLAEPVVAYRIHGNSAMDRHARAPDVWLRVHLEILDTVFANPSVAHRYGHLRSALEARAYYEAALVAYRGPHRPVVRSMAWQALTKAFVGLHWREAARYFGLVAKAGLPAGVPRRTKLFMRRFSMESDAL